MQMRKRAQKQKVKKQGMWPRCKVCHCQVDTIPMHIQYMIQHHNPDREWPTYICRECATKANPCDGCQHVDSKIKGNPKAYCGRWFFEPRHPELCGWSQLNKGGE